MLSFTPRGGGGGAMEVMVEMLGVVQFCLAGCPQA